MKSKRRERGEIAFVGQTAVGVAAELGLDSPILLTGGFSDKIDTLVGVGQVQFRANPLGDFIQHPNF